MRVQESWPRRVFNVLHGKLCTPSWTWQARFTWPQVTDGYKFYRDTRGEWQTEGGEGGNLVSSWFCWFCRRETEREREDESFKTEVDSLFLLHTPQRSGDYGFAIRARGQDGQSQKTSTKRKRWQDGVVTLFHVGSEMAPWKPPVWAWRKEGGRRRGKWRSGRGSLCWLSPSERSCYELVVNLSIL